ncbi:hypothetical protein [Methylobacterium sp. WL6]|uniref:hypothetical protein n=1 Tax=Methylobacterium sp. WL6 TaxID=2603901 RepID=UPI0011C7CCE2|nr:hypothetical protein [Methylobacterium sp. WL6]TXN72399.1 hypothetical protein FV230_05070 [Methylobacterium sp. WL6]
MNRVLLVALALACASTAALAQTAAPVTTVDVPWSGWLTGALSYIAPLAVTALAGIATKAIYQVAPMARLVLTQNRVEQLGTAVTQYAINAIDGATKDGKLTIPVGSAVIAKAVQRGIDAAPAAALKAAGGPNGLAEIVFRKLNLVDEANAANTLAPAQAAIAAK